MELAESICRVSQKFRVPSNEHLVAPDAFPSAELWRSELGNGINSIRKHIYIYIHYYTFKIYYSLCFIIFGFEELARNEPFSENPKHWADLPRASSLAWKQLAGKCLQPKDAQQQARLLGKTSTKICLNRPQVMLLVHEHFLEMLPLSFFENE